jgi:hypothetical protein
MPQSSTWPRYAKRSWSRGGATRPCLLIARDLIEALVSAGRTAEAEREVSIFEQESRQTERPSALAALACCRGLIASPDAIDEFFRDSLAYGSGVVGPFEHARTLLAYGLRLREVGEPPTPWNTSRAR